MTAKISVSTATSSGSESGTRKIAGAGLEVEVLRPAAEQVRRDIGGERVAVAVEVGAEEVREAALAGGAVAAGAVRRGHHAVAGLERRAVARVRGGALPHGLDDPDVLVTLDQRVRRPALRLAARVLLDLAAERVLVGAADARGDHPQQHGAGLELGRIRVVVDLELVGRDERRGLDGGHASDPSRWPASRRDATNQDTAPRPATPTAVIACPTCRRHVHPRAGLGAQLLAARAHDDLALEHVELDVAHVDVRLRAHPGHADVLVDLDRVLVRPLADARRRRGCARRPPAGRAGRRRRSGRRAGRACSWRSPRRARGS